MGMFTNNDDRDDRGKGKGSMFTQPMGPLPVWGWITVAVAGIFLYRVMVKPKAPATTEGAGGPKPGQFYPQSGGGIGGVFLIPSGAGAAAPIAPPETEPPPASTTTGFFNYVDRMKSGLGGKSLEELAAWNTTDPAGALAAYTSVAQAGGFPYTQGDRVINPKTGQSFPVTSWNTMTIEQRLRAASGDPAFWATQPASQAA